MLLRGAQDLLPEAAAAAVRAEDALGGVLDPFLGPGGEGVLLEVDALFLQLSGLPVGEVDLDGGGAPVGDLLTEFVAVLAGGQQQGTCSWVTSARKTFTSSASVFAESEGCAWAMGAKLAPPIRSAPTARIDLALRLMNPPRWGLSDRPGFATAANRCQAHDSS